METNETIRTTAGFYCNNQKSVHITMKSGQWYNGIITSISDKFLILMEEVYGEMMILFERIKEDGIVPREERR